MINWQSATRSERRLYKAAQILFLKHSKLLEFLFQPHAPMLRKSAEELIQEAQGFSSGEKLLIRLALDIWNEQGIVHFSEILSTLDSGNICNLILTLQYLYENKETESLVFSRQLKRESWQQAKLSTL